MQPLTPHSRRHDITFHRNGLIEITSRVANALDLQRGDVIDICTDGTDFYLYIRQRQPCKGLYRGTCFPTKPKGTHNFRCQHIKLCQKILSIVGASSVAKLPAGQVRTLPDYGTAISIITKLNLNTQQ